MPKDFIQKRSLTIVYGDVALEPYSTIDCESPDRVWTILSHVKDLADFVEPVPCQVADLLLCHTESLIASVKRDRLVFQAAASAAGGAIQAAERALVGPAFALDLFDKSLYGVLFERQIPLSGVGIGLAAEVAGGALLLGDLAHGEDDSPESKDYERE